MRNQKPQYLTTTHASQICVCVLLLLSLIVPANAADLGVLAFRGEEPARKRWQPTIDYLNASIPNTQFTLVPLDLDAMRTAVATDQIDFILTNPGNYVELEAEFAISRIATLQSTKDGDPETPVQSAIIVHSKRDDLNTIADLENQRLQIVSDKAFGGFQVAWHELEKYDINPFEDLQEIVHSGFPKDKIVYAVINGDADVGFVRSCVVESMEFSGDIPPDLIKILGAENYPDSRCRASTPAYPDWPIAKSANTSDALAKQVSMALMALTPTHDAALNGNYHGWTIPVDYHSVHDLFYELEIGPYAWLRQTTLKTLWRDYWQWFVILMIGLGWWLWHVFRIEQLVRVRTQQLQQEIHEREEAERQLSLRQDELAHVARLDTAGELAKGIAHELNQPLSAITSYVQGCKWRLDADSISHEEMIRITERVHSQADRAASIVERLRNFLRKGELKLTPMQINPVVRDALALFSSEAKKHEVTITTDWSSRLPMVEVEPVQLQQVIINLLRNAVDAMQEIDKSHRNIRLSTRLDTENDTVIIDILDSGAGVAQENIPKLFEPFFTTKSNGMGIGLSLSKSIMENFDGSLCFHPESSSGAHFSIELPIHTDATE